MGIFGHLIISVIHLVLVVLDVLLILLLGQLATRRWQPAWLVGFANLGSQITTPLLSYVRPWTGHPVDHPHVLVIATLGLAVIRLGVVMLMHSAAG